MADAAILSKENLPRFFVERVKEVGDFLREQNKARKKLEDWQEIQLAHFMGILVASVTDLVRADAEQKISTLAWIVRNLLELSIWIHFCLSSDENARRFQDDSVRDLYGWSKAILGMQQEKNSDEHKKLSKKMGELEEFAMKLGLGALSDDFKQVREAARELGREKEFSLAFKVYSKFAHPTAWVVRTASSIEADAGIRDMFFDDGVELAYNSLRRIRERLLVTYPEAQSGDKIS